MPYLYASNSHVTKAIYIFETPLPLVTPACPGFLTDINTGPTNPSLCIGPHKPLLVYRALQTSACVSGPTNPCLSEFSY